MAEACCIYKDKHISLSVWIDRACLQKVVAAVAQGDDLFIHQKQGAFAS